jgi:hypothetical protein
MERTRLREPSFHQGEVHGHDIRRFWLARRSVSLTTPATLCTIDKAAERGQDCMHSFAAFRRAGLACGGLVMKTVRISVLILCAGFASVAWGQQPPCKHPSPWGEFHRQNMQRWNPCEKVLGVNNVGNLGLRWSYATDFLGVCFACDSGWGGVRRLISTRELQNEGVQSAKWSQKTSPGLGQDVKPSKWR